MTIRDAAKEAGIGYTTARKRMHNAPGNGREWRERKAETTLSGPIPYEQLSPEATRALTDFEYFRLRYFGHVSTPWQIEAAQIALELLASEDKEYCVVNCPPGAGKTSLFTHDIPVWLTVRNRAIRGIIGSKTYRQAEIHCNRIKRTLERLTRIEAKDDEKRWGLAVDAEATLAEDYGRFKPQNQEIWTRGQFTVAQFGETSIDEKESTWTAFGQDTESLGWRVNYITWDDLVSTKGLKTVESIEDQRRWWNNEAEKRLEPRGVLMLPGQRLGANDLYRYNLDKVLTDDDGEATQRRKYRHIIYKAHYDELCTEDHRPSEAKPYPEGCLLDPRRVPWKEVSAAAANDPDYQTVYQQEDTDPARVLVDPAWIKGGIGVDGANYPGCWDKDRGLCELPKNLEPPLISIATADPSPTRFWSIQHWVYQPATEQRFLMDLIRQTMDAPDFLDYNPQTRSYSGIMDEWQQRSIDLGVPITYWIVEANAAQRFMLQYAHTQQWATKHSVSIIPHQTHRNKSDPDFGVQSIAPHYRFGRVRLPGKQNDPGRYAALKLVDEVTRWPESTYDDCVMAHWFMEWNLPSIWIPTAATPKFWTPHWMKEPA